MEAEIATQAVGLASSTDFSLINLFLRADIVVKSVIIILILASVYSWALIFDKYRLFKRIQRSSSIFEDKFWSSKSAESFYKSLPSKTKDPIAKIFRSAMVELIKSKSKRNLYLVLCGDMKNNADIKADLIEEDIQAILQWSQTTFESSIS